MHKYKMASNRIKKFLIYTVGLEVTKILFVKDYTHKGKELCHVKTKGGCRVNLGKPFQLN